MNFLFHATEWYGNKMQANIIIVTSNIQNKYSKKERVQNLPLL